MVVAKIYNLASKLRRFCSSGKDHNRTEILKKRIPELNEDRGNEQWKIEKQFRNNYS